MNYQDRVQLDRVPMPPSGRGRRSPWPYRQMQVGDSFFAPGRGCLPTGQWGNMCNAVFTARKVTENGVQGLRVWRIA